MTIYHDQVEILSKLFPSLDIKNASDYDMHGVMISVNDLISGDQQILIYRQSDWTGFDEHVNNWLVDIMVDATLTSYEFEGFIKVIQFLGNYFKLK